MLGKNNHRYGKKVSDATRLKMSESHRGLIVGPKNHLYGKPSPRRKKVRYIDTGEVFESITLAAKNKNIKRRNLSNCINGWSLTAGSYNWEVI